MTRVAVIGIDAGEVSFIERLIAEDKTPHLASLKDESVRFQLTSERTWRAGRVWETFLTGVADWPSAIVFDPDDYSTSYLGARRKRPFFADQDLTVVALDVPYMNLWHETEGMQVSAWGGHDAGFPRASNPPGTLTEIDQQFGRHPAFLNDFTCGWHNGNSISVLTEALVTGAERRARVLRWLQEQTPDWDLTVTVMSEAHSAGEFFWHGVERDHPLSDTDTAALALEQLEKTHQAIDSAVGDIVSSLPDDCAVVVCSLHGMQTNLYDIPSMVLVPELLHRWHFGAPALKDPDQRAWERSGRPYVTMPRWQRWEEFMRWRFADDRASRLRRSARLAAPFIFEMLRQSIRRALGRTIIGHGRLSAPIPEEVDVPPADIPQPRVPLKQVPTWYRARWPEMRAFALPSFYDARIRVNLRGRERDGIVAKEDYEATCDEVEALLRSCTDPRTGGSLVDRVERPRADDPFDPDGPDGDLVVTWTTPSDSLHQPEVGLIGPFPYRRTGGHTDRGFAWIRGPGIAARDAGRHEAVDLTPTLLTLLGRDPSSIDAEGTPLPIEA